jgi:hypothetical protein
MKRRAMNKDTSRHPSFVWIPRAALESQSQETFMPKDFAGMALPTLSGERIYDLGRQKNWDRFWHKFQGVK